MIDAPGELPSRCVLDNGKESARIRMTSQKRVSLRLFGQSMLWFLPSSADCIATMNSLAKMGVCSKCKKEKKIEDFYKSSTRKCGYESGCKDCRRAAASRYERSAQGILKRQAYEQRIRGDLRNVLQKAMEQAKRRARKQGVPFDLTVEYLESLVVSHCPITEEPLDWEKRHVTNGRFTKNSPSLDRIIPGLGYVPGNCAFLSHKANTIKSNGTAEEHSRIVQYIMSATSTQWIGQSPLALRTW